jgi:SulP family sulfate permease
VIALARAVKEGRITWGTLPREVLAGLVVGVVAIPLTMAFAIASGLQPEQGLVTGIVAGIVVAVFGGSQVQVAGPTGAFIVVLLGIVHDHGVDGLLVAGAMAGVILVALGLARLGRVVRYIPHPVTIGFTAGIGVIIFMGQVPDFLGLRLEGSPRDFLERVRETARAAGTTSLPTLAVAGSSLAAILLWKRFGRALPPYLVGMLVGTALHLATRSSDVATIGSRFGGIPSGLPGLRVPAVEWSSIGSLVAPAFAIAMLGAIESLLSAVVADGMTGDVHDSDQELVGQGLANLVTPFFGGFAATGAIARTATNVRNGGRTPVAGIVHSLTLVAVIYLLAPYAAHVPLASLAAILFVVAWNMSEVPVVASLLRTGSRSDRLVLLATLGLTVFVDLVVAVEVGVVLAALLFMKHMSERVEMSALLREERRADPYHGLATALPPEIAVYSVDGPFFFGVAHRFEETVGRVDPRVRVLVVRLWRVPYLDASGLHALRRVVHAFRREGRRVLLSGVRPEVQRELERTSLLRDVGEENVWGNLEEALACARDHLTDEGLARGAGGAGVPAAGPRGSKDRTLSS